MEGDDVLLLLLLSMQLRFDIQIVRLYRVVGWLGKVDDVIATHLAL